MKTTKQSIKLFASALLLSGLIFSAECCANSYTAVRYITNRYIDRIFLIEAFPNKGDVIFWDIFGKSYKNGPIKVLPCTLMQITFINTDSEKNFSGIMQVKNLTLNKINNFAYDIKAKENYSLDYMLTDHTATACEPPKTN